MKVLIISTYYKPGYKAGGPIQSVYNLSRLMGNDMQIYVLTQSNDFGTLEKMEVVENSWLNNDNHFVKYVDAKTFNLKTIVDEIQKLDFKIVYFNSLFSTNTWKCLIFNYFNRLELKIIVAPRGELDSGALVLKKNKKHCFLYLIKLFVKKNIVFHATTDNEFVNISSWFNNKIIVAQNVPNFVKIKPIKRAKEEIKTNLVFISRISPKKNLNYCIDILSMLDVDGELNFHIIGPKEDESYWASIQSRFKELPKNVNVKYLGEVRNEDLLDKTLQYHYLFFPTLAENYGHVIYECLSYGIPVIISNNTPWIQENNGVFVNSLNDPTAFKKLIEEKHKYDNLDFEKESHLAFKYAQTKADFPALIYSYKKLFDENTK